MEIIIPETDKNGREVKAFLESTLSETQIYKVYEKMEDYQKRTILQLIQTEKLEKMWQSKQSPYELRIPIDRANLRFFGALCSDRLILLHVINKKTQKIPERELKNIRKKISLFKCENYK